MLEAPGDRRWLTGHLNRGFAGGETNVTNHYCRLPGSRSVLLSPEGLGILMGFD